MFQEITISDSYETDETWQGRMQSSKPIKRAWVTETVWVFVVNSSVVVSEILYIKVIGRDISGGHFSKLETFVVKLLMATEDRNCAGQWYTKSVPWKRKSWIKLSDQSLLNSLLSWHLTLPLITTVKVMNCEMPSLPDTLQVLLFRFASTAWSMTLNPQF